MKTFVAYLKRFAFAVYAADTVIIASCVDQGWLTKMQAVDIGAIIAAVAAGFHGGTAVAAIKANSSEPVVQDTK